eukprot:COSAG01_NODE_1216_length_11192_cov_10.328678_6_plen_225_part_00
MPWTEATIPHNAPKAGRYDTLIKLLVIGDTSVGKTCLVLRFSEDTYHDAFITTIGIDFKIKLVDNIEPGVRAKLQIWDTAGQERFRTITQAYYRGAGGILLTYDVTSRASFESIRGWVRNIQQHAAGTVVRVLLGNKCDREDAREVSVEEGQQLADELGGIDFFEASAKMGTNVDEAFLTLAQRVRAQQRQAAPSGGAVPSVPVGGGSGQGRAAVAAKRSCQYC